MIALYNEKELIKNKLMFMYFQKLDVAQDRERAEFKTVKGTRKLHSVASTNKEGQIINIHQGTVLLLLSVSA